MPLAYSLAFHQGLALRGLWLGRAVASVGSGLTMLVLWRWRMWRSSTNSVPASLSLVTQFSSSP